MISKVKKIIKKYPIIIGIFCILLLLWFIIFYWYLDRQKEIMATVVPEELQREANIEQLNSPEEAALYFAQAIKNKDFDQLMRVFPIDEICLNQNTIKIINKNREFSYDQILAPSMKYRDYFVLASAELTKQYAEKYLELSEMIEEIDSAVIEKIDYLFPEKQLSEDYQISMYEKCDTYGANYFCDMEVELSVKNEIYSIPLTVVRYGNYWKVFKIGTDIQEEILNKTNDTNVQEKNFVSSKSKELSKKITRASNLQEKNDIKKEDKEEQNEILKTGQGMLPSNYFVSNAVYEDTPEQTIKTFVQYVQKRDLAVVLTLGNIGETERDLKKVSIEELYKQGEFADKLKYFYYSFLLEERPDKKIDLMESEITAEYLLEKLSPEKFFYLELKEIVKRENNEYLVYFKYGNHYYSFHFILSEFTKGWQIKDIKDSVRLSEKEYNKVIQNLEG